MDEIKVSQYLGDVSFNVDRGQPLGITVPGRKALQFIVEDDGLIFLSTDGTKVNVQQIEDDGNVRISFFAPLDRSMAPHRICRVWQYEGLAYDHVEVFGVNSPIVISFGKLGHLNFWVNPDGIELMLMDNVMLEMVCGRNRFDIRGLAVLTKLTFRRALPTNSSSS